MSDAELDRVERELERLRRAEPSAGLRARVARRVSGELARQTIDRWTFAGLAAAAVVLWANLSWSVSRNTTYAEPPAAIAEEKAVAQIRELFPEMSETEARRQAIVLRGANRLPNGNAARRAAALGVTY